MVVTGDEVAAGGGVGLATEGGEVGGYFEPIVEEEGLVGEGLAAVSAFVAIDATESFGGVMAVTVEPGRCGGIKAMSGAAGAGTEEVIGIHVYLH